jgi:hypothetical protein
MIAFTEAEQRELAKAYAAMDLEKRSDSLTTGETIWKAPYDYKGGHYDHFLSFFNAIRRQGTIVQDPTFGLRAGGAALLANESYQRGMPVTWDPLQMKLG